MNFTKEELDLFESKVLGLTLTKIKDWNKPYNEIVVPKGFRKIKIWELWQLLESEERDKFLGTYKGKYNYFWCEQTNYAKENNYPSGLYLNMDLIVYSYDDILAFSLDDGRVVFVKEKTQCDCKMLIGGSGKLCPKCERCLKELEEDLENGWKINEVENEEY